MRQILLSFIAEDRLNLSDISPLASEAFVVWWGMVGTSAKLKTSLW